MYKEIRDKCPYSTNCAIIGSIGFTNLPQKGNELPSTIRYTIRVVGRGEVSLTTETFPKFKNTMPRGTDKYGAYMTAVVC